MLTWNRFVFTRTRFVFTRNRFVFIRTRFVFIRTRSPLTRGRYYTKLRKCLRIDECGRRVKSVRAQTMALPT